MAKFLDHREFVGNSSTELKASEVTKDQLKYIASGFEIPFQHDIRKDDLMTPILTHLEDPCLSKTLLIESQTKDPNILLEMEKLKMKALQMQIEYEKGKKERQR